MDKIYYGFLFLQKNLYIKSITKILVFFKKKNFNESKYFFIFLIKSLFYQITYLKKFDFHNFYSILIIYYYIKVMKNRKINL